MRYHVRSRPDYRHVALEHIKHLWQFVERRFPQKTPHCCDSRIGLGHRRLIVRWIISQSTELQAIERAAFESGAQLAIEYRARRCQLNRYCYGYKKTGNNTTPTNDAVISSIRFINILNREASGLFKGVMTGSRPISLTANPRLTKRVSCGTM